MQAANTIRNLHKEMGELRGASASEENSLSKFIQNDYFYKELSKKPKVSFIVQDEQSPSKDADPVDSIMEQRPAKGLPQPARKGKYDKRKSFITNVKLAPSDTVNQLASAASESR